MIKEILNTITWLLIFLVICYLLFNGVFYITCLASEGEPYFNKIIYACHFEDKFIQTSQIITNQYSEIKRTCFIDDKKVNCSEII